VLFKRLPLSKNEGDEENPVRYAGKAFTTVTQCD
jgi:hypothetical protein